MTSRSPAPFGTVLGFGPGNVPVYSSDYDSVDENELPDRSAFRHYVDGIYMGYKWQCVELARRWLYLNRGYIFDDIAMAYDIFRLTSVRVVANNSRLPLHSFRNGARRPPEPGCLLIWDEGGEFRVTGHVAVVTEVTDRYVRVIEQNVDDAVWPEGQLYSRELPARVSADGEYWIRCSFNDASVLGWVIQTDDATHAEVIEPMDPHLLDLEMHQLPIHHLPEQGWLNTANPDEEAYEKMMGGDYLAADPALRNRYLTLTRTARDELKRATNELHALFMHATHHVLQHPELLENFNIPRCLWDKIRQSWDNRRNQMITGRFDFSLSHRGIKVYEYNADSASCYMETGKIQGKWCDHFELDEGRDAGAKLASRLIRAWKRSQVNGVLHILQDEGLEETYHALFMKEAIEAAGLECEVIIGFDGLSWGDDGSVLDRQGRPIRWVWKTWAWETALDQIRAECGDDPEKLRNYIPGEVRPEKPRLVDVLLRQEVMVYEPLWTLIPSNKAILAVLWQLFPNHRYLLNAGFELDEVLANDGYVSKPIAGRCGENIRLFDRESNVIEHSGGQFGHQNLLYQQLWPLPRLDGYNVQLCTFAVEGRYSGACVRVDPGLVIKSESDVIALRVVDDPD